MLSLLSLLLGGCVFSSDRSLVPAGAEENPVLGTFDHGACRAGDPPASDPDLHVDTSGHTVDRTFTWGGPPRVRVCARSGIPVDTVREALAFWEERGFRFRDVFRAECSFSADGVPLRPDGSAPMYGVVTVTRLGQLVPEGCAGSTRWATYGSVALWALVELPPGDVDPLALEHELGHAVGYPHVRREGSLMHPAREHMGADTSALTLPG